MHNGLGGGFQASPQQGRLWRLEADPSASAYRCSGVLRIIGDLDAQAVARRLLAAVQRHEILRTTFQFLPGLSLPLQVVREEATFAFESLDLSGLEPALRQARWNDLRVAQSRFDMDRGEVLRTRLVRLAEREHALLLELPALCADGPTLELLAEEIAGRPGSVEPEPLQYADVAEWQNQILDSPESAEDLNHWRRFWRERDISTLVARPLPLELPEAGRSPFRPEEIAVPVPVAAASLVADENASLPFLLACWQILVWRSTGSPAVLVGVLQDGRRYEELSGTLGPLARYLPVHARLHGDLLLRDVIAAAAGASAETTRTQERFSWRHAAEDGAKDRFFPICLTSRRSWSRETGGMRFALESCRAVVDRFKLELLCEHRPNRTADLALRFDASRFRREDVEILADRFPPLLESAAGDPEVRLRELAVLGRRERALLVSIGGSRPGAEPSRNGSAACLRQLFEERAESAPERVAIAAGDLRITFRELNARANGLANYLIHLGIGAEVPVALFLERSPDALIAILAVLKAGGAWVPLDPTHPVERLARIVDDIRPLVVLTCEPLAGLLPTSDARVVRLDAEAAAIASRPASNPTRAALPDALAYVIYTSGSTGHPKGVMVASRSPLVLQAGLEAAVRAERPHGDPLRVSLNAPLTFDASVQQLALLAAGHTLQIIPEEVRTDGAALVRFLGENAVDLFDCTPSQLRLLIAGGLLEAPGPVPRIVLVAGEAVDVTLWAALQGARRTIFFNLYGPTECTVDATACRITGLGAATGPTIGRPLAGYEVLLLDAALSPVPIGAPGEIFLGGGGLARGYARQPGATAERFVPHPFSQVPGERLYRTGDLARWNTHGDLEFLGRADEQVKLRGYRIEPGEIEAALVQHSWVRQAAVVVRTGGAEEDRRLAAYVVPSPEAPPGLAGGHEELHSFLRRRLPVYMVPSFFVPLAALPTTPHGKLDRRTLALSGPLPDSRPGTPERLHTPPRNETEELLAEIWRDVLRLDRIEIEDNFFALGGDSILSIQVVARAARAGLRLTARQMFEQQTIAGIAAVVERLTPAAAPEMLSEAGPVPLTPIQKAFFERGLPYPEHFNQALLLQPTEPIDPAHLRRVIAALLARHDALRLRFALGRQTTAAIPQEVPFTWIDLSALPQPAWRAALEGAAAALQASLDLESGPLLRSALFTPGAGEPDRLLLIVHHLAIDGVSWRLLLDEMETACRQLAAGEPVDLPPASAPYRVWAERLAQWAATPEIAGEAGFWRELLGAAPPPLPVNHERGDDTVGSARTVTVSLDEGETLDLLQKVPRAYRTRIDDVLLTALAQAFHEWTGGLRLLVDLEAHGRESPFGDVDVSRTVGWFTAVFPVLLDLEGAPGAGEALRRVKERLRAVPGRGIGYGLLRYLASGEEADLLRAAPRSQVAFNYLGQLDASIAEGRLFRSAGEPAGGTRHRVQPRSHLLEVNAAVSGGRFRAVWSYGENRHRRETVEILAGRFLAALRGLIAHCLSDGATGYTTSDFPLAGLGQPELDCLLAADREVEDVYPLAPLQEGVLLHSLLAPGTGLYVCQVVYTLRGDLDPGALAGACRAVVEAHPVLRTSFHWEGLERALQVVHRQVEPELVEEDWRGLPQDEIELRLARLLRADRSRGFDLSRPRLTRWGLFRTGETEHRLLWSLHHITLDGWSFSAVAGDLLRAYEALRRGVHPQLPQRRPYRDYIAWLETRDAANEEEYWRRALAGFTTPTPLAVDRVHAGERRGAETRQARLPALAWSVLQSRARQLQLTPNLLVQAAWGLLLGRYSGQSDVVFGATFSGRSADLPDVDQIVGLFINTLPVRITAPAGTALAPWLLDLQKRHAEMLQHEHSPLVMVQGWSEVPHSSPLFESLLVFENYPREATLRQGGASLGTGEVRVVERTNYPLAVVAIPGEELRMRMDYEVPRLDAPTVVRMLGHLQTLLVEMAAASDETPLGNLPMLTSEERAQLIREWNDTAADLAPGCIHELFERQVARAPQAPALLGADGERWTYGELDRRADGLAGRLARLGVEPGGLVAVFLDRSPFMVAALLGILKAGAVYVPLDHTYPEGRIAWILAQLGIRHLVTESALVPAVERLLPERRLADVLEIDRLAGEPFERPRFRASAEDLAYIIFTSGTTGTPKGVVVRHGPVVNLIEWVNGTFGIGPSDRVLFLTSLCFDLSVYDLFGILAAGGSVRVASAAEVREPQALLEILRREPITFWDSAPAALQQLVPWLPESPGEGCDALRLVFLSGDWIPVSLPDRIRGVFPRARIVALGGATEATVWSNVYPIEEVGRSWSSIPYGRPIRNARYHVLGSTFEPCPIGVEGDLYIGGDCLSDGYVREPALTAGKYLPDPWSERPGGRLYATGDRARCWADGTLEFLGRLDQQVKIRGFRIELGEIETVLAGHPGVRAAAVVAREDAPGDRRLVAYVVGDVATDALRQRLRERLPEYMVPAAFITLAALPLTPNGKLDRNALRAPEWQRPAESYLAPRTPVEEVVAGIWAELLGLERVGSADHFFDLGGHSLLATRVMSRLRAAFGIDMPLRDLFEAPTPADLAARVEVALRAGAERPALPLAPMAPTLREGPLPLSFAQQRLWFIDQLEPGSPLYNIPAVLRVEGPLDFATLALCLGEIVRRHEVLRTVFATQEGSPVQVIRPAAPFVPAMVDLSGLPEDGRGALATSLAGEEAGRPFDLQCGPLLRSVLLRLAEDDHVAVLTTHHIASDGWSMGILVREVTALYPAFAEGRPSPLPELAVQYADFAVWQRAWLHGEVLENEVSYWRQQLAGLPPLLSLPTDRPRPAVQSFRGASRPVRLPAELIRQAQALSRREGATLFMVLLAAFQALLARYSGQDDLAVGTPVAGRNRVEIEESIGFFVNTLVLRCDLSGDPSFRDLLGRVRETALAAHTHQDVPFERLVRELTPERSLAQTPLFQVMFALQNAPVESLEIQDLRLRPVGGAGAMAKFDLTLTLGEHDGGLSGSVGYATDLFDAAAIDRLIQHFERLLTAAVSTPDLSASALPLLNAVELHELVQETLEGSRPIPAPGRCIHELFVEQVARTPEALAVVDEEGAWTYAELGRRVRRLALRLRALGVGPDQPVILCAERGAGLVTGLLGILEAGGAYLAVEPDLPRTRQEILAQNAHAAMAVTERRLAGALPDGLVRVFLDPEDLEDPDFSVNGMPRAGVTPGHLAYVLYTSGSTGQPKGVMVEHRQLAAYVHGVLERLAPPPGASFATVSSFSADLGNTSIFAALLSGGCLHVVARERLADAEAFAEWMERRPVDVLKIVPSHLSALLTAERPERSLPRRLLVLGGEPLPWSLVDRVRALAPECRLFNHYGPTETTVGALAGAVETGAGRANPSAPLGRPLGLTRAWVVDRHLQLVPAGLPGELCVGGLQVTRGYLGRPDLTAERFIPDPFSGDAGGRLYRTGDLVRRRPDGRVQFLGRSDGQIKVRGFRIELGEIEALLVSLAGVREAVVLSREDRSDRGPGDRRLVAYVVGDVPADALRRLLGERLPDYMVPVAFVTLATLPLTPNGKVDRKALPAPEWQSAGESYLAPRTPVEEILAGIWAEVLGLERVGAADHFFDLGGHSLLATQVMSRLRSAFDVEMPLRDLFEAPTLADLAARVEAALRTGARRPTPPLVPVARERPLPLSFAQQRLWFIDQLEPGSPLYNMPVALHVDGPLDARVLALCLGEVVRRHEALRSVFTELEGSPVQVIQPAAPFGFPVVDLSGLPQSRQEARASSLAGEEALRPFDLSRGPLLRGLLLRLAAEAHVVALTMHHIASDGWSKGILVREVRALYTAFAAARRSPLPELPVQYADFAVWQHSWLHGEVLESEVSFWRRQLAALPPRLELPTDRPRPAVQSFRGASRPVRLPAALTAQAQALSRREGATLFMVLLAGFQALLARYGGQDDLAVGIPVAGRNRVEVEELIGFFINTLVLRGDLAGEPSFRELLSRTRETALAAHTHQDVPFEKLVQELSPERSLAQTPLFQVMFVLQNTPTESLDVQDLRLRPVSGAGTTAKFDLTLELGENNGGVAGAVEYATALFDATTIDRLIARFESLLTAAVEAPGCRVAELPLLTAAERHQVLVEWNDTALDRSEAPLIHELFEAWAGRTPDAPAVICARKTLTYAELDARAQRLAYRLRGLGCGPQSRVGIALERSLDLVIALLGVLKAGAAYVPLDPAYPRERLALVLEDAAPQVSITETHLLPALPRAPGAVLCLDGEPVDGSPAGPDGGPPISCDDRQLAYVLFTSGSTGRPKGVGVPHRALVNFLDSMRRAPGFAPGERILAVTSLSFDIAALELFLPLTTGGCIELATREEAADGALLAARLRASGAGVLQATPATWRMLLDAGWTGEPGLLSLCGGEALPRELAASLARRTRELWNLYGPTETTVWSAAARIPPAETGPVSIGRPIVNTRILLLDRKMQPVPLGVPGELWIGGAGLARGYLGRPDLTAERFLPDPFASEAGEPGGRLYRTGDLARHLPGGRMEVLGRIDHQIKLRGFRIELGEIEAALSALDGVREAVVLAREDRSEDRSKGAPGDRRLVAYVVGDATADALRRALRERLPDYTVPAAFVRLAKLPLTPNGKVDRGALPAPEPRRPDESNLAPRTPVEEVLAGIWAELLGLERIGTADHFFDLGGHSLLATQVISRLRSAFSIEMPLRELFEHPTLAGFASIVERALAAGPAGGEPPLELLPRGGPLPVSFAQRRLWLVDQIEPGNPIFHLPLHLRLRGPLLVTALERAFREVVRRNEVLRTRFLVVEGEPAQVVDPPPALSLPVIDLEGLPEAERVARRLAAMETQRPFDLADGPIFRVMLVRSSREDHVVVATLHHIAGDRWSLDVLAREVALLYGAFAQGAPSPLPDLSRHYADFAGWQRRWLQGERLAKLVEHWRGRLIGAPEVLQLPEALPRPAVRSYRGAERIRILPGELMKEIRALARRESATVFMTLLAAFKALLHVRTGSTDLVIGSDIANRTRLEAEPLIGFFINQLALRTNLSGNPSFRELLARVREVCLAAYAHQELPFEHLVESLLSRRSLQASPLFQVKLGVHRAAPPAVPFAGLAAESFHLESTTSELDMNLRAIEEPDRLVLVLGYKTDIYTEATMRHLLEQLETLLREVVTRPESNLETLASLLHRTDRAHRLARDRELESVGRDRLLRRRQEGLGRAVGGGV